LDTTLIAAVFALSAAFAWGAGDFTNGITARRIGPFHTVLLSFIFGVTTLVVLAFAVGEKTPPTADLVWGAVAGLLGTAGLLFLLRGFETGRMSIVAPVSAVLTAAIPVIISAFTEGLPRELQIFGFVLALASIWLLSLREEHGDRPAGLWMAMLAGLGFGCFFAALNQIGDGAVFWPLVAGRSVSFILLILIALFSRRNLIPASPPWGLLALGGVLDVVGNYFFLLAVQTGRLDIASVLASLYPAITTILAWIIVKERMTRIQTFGVVVAVLSIVLINV
jgi:drug/metabolite transporter (DMT)-like permease